MGGTSDQIQANSLGIALDNLAHQIMAGRECGLRLDSVSILIKKKDGTYDRIGDDGIETTINVLYGKKPEGNVVIFFHLGC